MANKEIYKELKDRIVFLGYKPKQVLNIKNLSKKFGVSPMPIREFLIFLKTEKLVHIIPINLKLKDRIKTIIPNLIHLVGDQGRTKYLICKNEQLLIEDYFIKEDKR